MGLPADLDPDHVFTEKRVLAKEVVQSFTT